MSIWHVGLFELGAVHDILICCAHVLKSDVGINARSVTEPFASGCWRPFIDIWTVPDPALLKPCLEILGSHYDNHVSIALFSWMWNACLYSHIDILYSKTILFNEF